jgi:hypothetical protein
MKTPQNMQPSFDDEISIADIIHFLKSHKKLILNFLMIGAILGGLFGNFTGPVFKGSVLISPAKISGVFVENPKVIVTKLNKNVYISKETFLNCNPHFYKDKGIDYDLSSIVKVSLTKDFELIELLMQNKNKTMVKDCLNSMVDDILTNQNIIIDSYNQFKNNELKLAEKKLKDAEEFRSNLDNEQIKAFKKHGERPRADLLYMSIILSNSTYINEIITEINKIKTDLYSEQTKPASKLTISINEKTFPSLELGALIGLLLFLFLGILLALLKQMKI